MSGDTSEHVVTDRESPERGFSCVIIFSMATPRKKPEDLLKVGRPTKYTPSMCDKIDEYLEKCKDTIEDYHKTQGLKSDTYERLVLVDLPTIEKFADFIGVNESTIYEWKEKYPEFSKSLGKILKRQKHQLIDNALGGHYNPTIAKLILSANHNMIEKREVDVMSGGEPIKGFNYIAPDEAND